MFLPDWNNSYTGTSVLASDAGSLLFPETSAQPANATMLSQPQPAYSQALTVVDEKRDDIHQRLDDDHIPAKDEAEEKELKQRVFDD
jgi:hypothetical protein